MNQWFRLYSEFATDPKIQSMSEAMQRRYIMLMCLRCSNSLVTLQKQDVAFALRVTEAELEETLELFKQKKFIDDGFNLLNWDKRQFRSDSSKERVSKHRANKRNNTVTLQKRKSNALDTDTDTDTDTEDNKKKKRVRVSLDELSVDHIGEWLGRKRVGGKYLTHDEHFILEYFKNYCASNGAEYKDYAAALRNAFEWEPCQPKTNGALNGTHATSRPRKQPTAHDNFIAGAHAFATGERQN